MMCEPNCEKERIEQMIRGTLWSSGYKGVVIGVSGGVDSAVVVSLCTSALGKDHVIGLLLPSLISRTVDITDAQNLCNHLSIQYHLISIQPFLDTYKNLPGFTQDQYLLGNIMARLRMTILYYYANRENLLVCGTSNRSEYMLGYCTKFGDNAADIQPILHLYKTEVYKLASYLGIPETIIKKTPSAGLWTEQSDEDEIGLPYSDIDCALQALEKNGWNASTPAEKIILNLVKQNQHKRMPPVNMLGKY